MQVPHDSVILIADGKKMLLLRNEGNEAFPRFEVETKEEPPDLPTRDRESDGAGRASSGPSPGRHAYPETDFRQLEEDRFAASAAEMLKKGALRNDYEALIVVAPPRTLGALRHHYHQEVEKRLAGEIAKDLTGHPIPEIEKILLSQ